MVSHVEAGMAQELLELGIFHSIGGGGGEAELVGGSGILCLIPYSISLSGG